MFAFANCAEKGAITRLLTTIVLGAADPAVEFRAEMRALASDGCICLLAALAGGVLGFYWLRASISDDKFAKLFGARPIGVLLTVAGALVLARWGVVAPSPVHGLFWTLGTLIGICVCSRKLVHDYSAAGDSLPEPHRTSFRHSVRTWLFQDGHAATKKEAEKLLRKLMKDKTVQLVKTTEYLHAFIHGARDDAIQYLAAYVRLLDQAIERKDFVWFDAELSAEFKRYQQNALQQILGVFEALLGNPGNLWIAIRRVETTNDGRVYRTLHRVGRVHQNRQDSSVDIPEGIGLPQYLRRQYKLGKGIVRLTDDRTSDQWYQTANDDRGEDRSLMAGPVMVNARDPRTDEETREMFMILYVNSPKKNQFSADDEHVLRCCTDVLSLFYSMALNSLSRPDGMMKGNGQE